jgi:hypothetical protein
MAEQTLRIAGNRDGRTIAPTHRVFVEHMYPDRHGVPKPITSVMECRSLQGAESEATKARAWRPAPISVTVEAVRTTITLRLDVGPFRRVVIGYHDDQPQP